MRVATFRKFIQFAKFRNLQITDIKPENIIQKLGETKTSQLQFLQDPQFLTG